MNPVSKKSRNVSAQAIVEGAVALILIVILVVVGTLLIANVGVSMYYKQKLGFITDETAASLTSLDAADPNLQKDADAQATQTLTTLITKLGLLPAGKVSANLTEKTDVSAFPIVTVTATLSNLPLFGNGQVLPLTVSITDTGSSLPAGSAGQTFSGFLQIPTYVPPSGGFFSGIIPTSNGPPIYLPVVSSPPSGSTIYAGGIPAGSTGVVTSVTNEGGGGNIMNAAAFNTTSSTALTPPNEFGGSGRPLDLEFVAEKTSKSGN